MAKKKPKLTDPDRRLMFERFFAANYVLETVADLDGNFNEYMDGRAAAYGVADWRESGVEHLRSRFGLDDKKAIKKLFNAANPYLSERETEAFLLRGFKLPSPLDLVMMREQFITGQL
jgi:glycine betaine/choline ABC-type transport system substrate-binding protein